MMSMKISSPSPEIITGPYTAIRKNKSSHNNPERRRKWLKIPTIKYIGRTLLSSFPERSLN